MIILAIETSCDDTSVAVLEIQNSRFKILSNIVSSQVKIHRKWGGVYPSLAKREHQRNLPVVLKRALKEAGFVNPKFQITNPKQIQNSKFKNIDLLAVTAGPGLEPCLWVGVNFAKDLAQSLNLPLLPINHIEAHILANWLSPIGKIQPARRLASQRSGQGGNPKFKIQNLFPAICLIVSGGHTQLILMKDYGDYKIIGETRDDAAGECFDKTARILGLGYPGGPAIAQQAGQWKSQIPPARRLASQRSGQGGNPKSKIKLPRPMIYQKNYDFSFSGLKTAVLYKVKSDGRKIKSKKYIQEMSYEIQQAIIEVLIAKTIRAAKEFKVKTIILGGGVTANEELRRQFDLNLKSEILNLKFLVPPKIFCTDNAAMVATAAYYHWLKRKGKLGKKIEADANLRLG